MHRNAWRLSERPNGPTAARERSVRDTTRIWLVQLGDLGLRDGGRNGVPKRVHQSTSRSAGQAQASPFRRARLKRLGDWCPGSTMHHETALPQAPGDDGSKPLPERQAESTSATCALGRLSSRA